MWTYSSEVVKEFHLFGITVWREALESQDTTQLGRVVERVEYKQLRFDELKCVLQKTKHYILYYSLEYNSVGLTGANTHFHSSTSW